MRSSEKPSFKRFGMKNLIYFYTFILISVSASPSLTSAPTLFFSSVLVHTQSAFTMVWILSDDFGVTTYGDFSSVEDPMLAAEFGHHSFVRNFPMESALQRLNLRLEEEADVRHAAFCASQDQRQAGDEEDGGAREEALPSEPMDYAEEKKDANQVAGQAEKVEASAAPPRQKRNIGFKVDIEEQLMERRLRGASGLVHSVLTKEEPPCLIVAFHDDEQEDEAYAVALLEDVEGLSAAKKPLEKTLPLRLVTFDATSVEDPVEIGEFEFGYIAERVVLKNRRLVVKHAVDQRQDEEESVLDATLISTSTEDSTASSNTTEDASTT